MEQLTEVKKGQTGTGMLIESDGYISLNDKENKVLKESIDNFKNGLAHDLPYPFVVSAVFQKYGIENANGRIYPEKVLKREIEKYQQRIKNRNSFGECEHPSDSNINLERICMLVTELHWVGHTLVGKIEIPISEGFRKYGVCSTLADTVAQWIISGLKIGVSSRALGSVTQSMGKLIVSDDLDIICFDVVSTPSVPMAYIETNDENLKPYLEEETKHEDNIIEESVNSKLKEFENWLND